MQRVAKLSVIIYPQNTSPQKPTGGKLAFGIG
jgi:hypothetical protein